MATKEELLSRMGMKESSSLTGGSVPDNLENEQVLEKTGIDAKDTPVRKMTDRDIQIAQLNVLLDIKHALLGNPLTGPSRKYDTGDTSEH